MNTLIPISIKVVICWLFAGWSVQYLLGIRHNYRQLCWLFAGCFLTVARGGCIIRTAADSPTGGQRMPIGGNSHSSPSADRTPTAGGVPLRSALSQYQPGNL